MELTKKINTLGFLKVVGSTTATRGLQISQKDELHLHCQQASCPAKHQNSDLNQCLTALLWTWQFARPERSCHSSTPETHPWCTPSPARKLFSVLAHSHSFSSLLRMPSTIISASCCSACLYSQPCPLGTDRRPQGQRSSLEQVLTIIKSKTMENSQSIFCSAISCRIGFLNNAS